MGQLGGRASIEVDAPIDACWRLAEDVASAPDWQDGLEAMHVKERDAEGRVLLAESISERRCAPSSRSCASPTTSPAA